jgi:hypothetical protein
VAAAIAFWLWPGAALAEVSDKAASIPEHWLVATPAAALLFFAASFRWWLALPLGIVPTVLVSGSLDMTLDHQFGGALWHEQGFPYFLSLWSSDVFVVAALVLGGYRGWRRHRPKTEA